MAHSGLVLGVLFPDDAEQVTWASRRARTTLSGLIATHRRRLIGGGVAMVRRGRRQPVGP